jgi:carboxylesterase
MLGLRFFVHKPVRYDDNWLDSPLTRDIHFDDPYRLVSSRFPTPTEAQKQSPVMVLVHGFSASTFEFDAFKKAMSKKAPSIMYSSVIMGGHGRDYQSFKAASYSDWVAPIRDEVEKLTSMGYERIILFGVSTGATGILHLILDDQLALGAIAHVLLMDAYVKPKDASLFFVPVIQYVVKNTRSGAARSIETRHWHVNRPTSALVELLRLVKLVQGQLKNLNAYDGPPMTLFTAKNDPTADTRGSDLVSSKVDGARLVRYDSDRHVIIESQAKLDWTDIDQGHFDAVINHVFMTVFQ